MHLPNVSRELARDVQRSGIDPKEFGKLIMHWFPSAWSIFWTLQRRARPNASPKRSKRDEDATGRFQKLIQPLLGSKTLSEPPRPMENRRVSDLLSQRLGDKGVLEVHEVMASDAMTECAEKHFGMRYILESEDKIVGVPEGFSLPDPKPMQREDLERAYPHGFDLLRTALKSLGLRSDTVGLADGSSGGKSRQELVLLMAIQPHRKAAEDILGVHLAYQWPGVVAAVPRGAKNRLKEFQSPAAQLLAIHHRQQSS